MTAPADVLIATFDRRDGERLAVLFREYEGFHFLDLRIQFEKNGTWLPTKKGVTIKLRELSGVADAIAEACELAKGVVK
jgi:hypothetical protein